MREFNARGVTVTAVPASVSTAVQVAAERAVLVRLEADCNVPLAAFAEPRGEVLRLRVLLADLDGERVLRAEGEAPPSDAAALGLRVAEEILAAGGDALLEELRREAIG